MKYFFLSLTMLAVHSLTIILLNMQSGVPAKGEDRQIKRHTNIAYYDPNWPRGKFSKNFACYKLWCKIIKNKIMDLLQSCSELFQTFVWVFPASLYSAEGNILITY